MAVRRCVRNGLWRATNTDEWLALLRQLATDLSEIYGVDIPEVKLDERPCYSDLEEIVFVPNNSIVTFLHEYRHHLQLSGKTRRRDKEEDAKMWSLSLFKQALPRSFEHARRHGRLCFVDGVRLNSLGSRQNE